MGKVFKENQGNRIIIGFCRFYRLAISPYLVPACRYKPTCSEYAIEAAEKLPFFSAIWHIVSRLIRCHPLSKGGYDPVNKIQKCEHNHDVI